MKKIMALVLALLLSCSGALADSFSDLYGEMAYYDAVLDKSTGEFRIAPEEEAMTEYAADGMVMLPAVATADGVAMIMLVLKGTQENEFPTNVMVTTDTKIYTFTNKTPDAPQMQHFTIGDVSYSMIILSTDNAVLFREIGESESVEVRFSTNGESFNPELFPGVDAVVQTFELSDEVRDIFARTYTATEKSTSIMTDPMTAFAMNLLAAMNMTVMVEERSGLWD